MQIKLTSQHINVMSFYQLLIDTDMVFFNIHGSLSTSTISYIVGQTMLNQSMIAKSLDPDVFKALVDEVVTAVTTRSELNYADY